MLTLVTLTDIIIRELTGNKLVLNIAQILKQQENKEQIVLITTLAHVPTIPLKEVLNHFRYYDYLYYKDKNKDMKHSQFIFKACLARQIPFSLKLFLNVVTKSRNKDSEMVEQ